MATSALHAPTNTSKYFLNPQTGGPSPPEDYLYGRSAGGTTSPMTSQTPPSNVSPTSQYNVHVRQLRQPRQPLYVPAALRPTELQPGRDIPGRPRAPDTPPSSQHNSFDSAKASSQSLQNVVSIDSNSDEASRLHRSGSGAGSEGLEDNTAEITGPPTTAHWKPDASADTCAVCGVPFTWYFRRHHCRRCGNVICENHIKARVPLDQNARFHSKGLQSKACNPCGDEWKYLTKLRHSRASSIAESLSSSQDTAVPPPAISIPQAQRLIAEDQQRVGSMARSEGGMIWSTF